LIKINLIFVLFSIILVGCQAEHPTAVTIPKAAPTVSPIMRGSSIEGQPNVLPPTDSYSGTTFPAINSTSETSTTAQKHPADLPSLSQGTIVRVDVRLNSQPISSLIYGISDGSPSYLKTLRPTIISWGGNPNTRYNWKLGNAWNAGKDYLYKNGDYGNKTGLSVADLFISAAHSLDIHVRLAVPTLGWVAKDTTSCSFPNSDGSCGLAKGATCQKPGLIADPTTANVQSSPESISQWMQHLKDQGLVPDYIAMDNEPELWGYNHYDVHPKCTTYKEVLDKYLSYATAIRNVLPDVKLAGPVVCCWFSYWNTAPGPADPKPGEPTEYIAWFLDSIRKNDEATGKRTLDVLDVHFYPQTGVYNNNTDLQTDALRLRSTSGLWDLSYVDESWIKQPIYFIPRMQELIDKYYPGTQLGISEWNFGADGDINGALAIADVLGIFGREGVDYATYWRVPELDSPGYFAFKLYTNYDDQGSRFDGSTVFTTSNNPDLASYAAIDNQAGQMKIMLINKNPNQQVDLNLQVVGYTVEPSAFLYRYSNEQPDKIVKHNLSIPADSIPLTLPAYSISLIVLSAK
jgi:hypothetical protein